MIEVEALPGRANTRPRFVKIRPVQLIAPEWVVAA